MEGFWHPARRGARFAFCGVIVALSACRNCAQRCALAHRLHRPGASVCAGGGVLDDGYGRYPGKVANATYPAQTLHKNAAIGNTVQRFHRIVLFTVGCAVFVASLHDRPSSQNPPARICFSPSAVKICSAIRDCQRREISCFRSLIHWCFPRNGGKLWHWHNGQQRMTTTAKANNRTGQRPFICGTLFWHARGLIWN